MRNIAQNGVDLFKRFGGCSRTVYFCPAGQPTIGYGHVVKAHEDYASDINEAQGKELLRQDAMVAERAVLSLINIPLTDDQFDALVSSTYNLGGRVLQFSTMHRKINHEEYGEVPEQLLHWVWTDGQRLRELICRRE